MNATRTKTDADKTLRVILTSGEALDVCHDDHLGVHTDAGCHAWDECEAFIVWSKSLERFVTVPLN